MKNKIIVFDFDKTLTHRDTVLPFFSHVAERNIWLPFKIISYLFLMIAFKARLIKNLTLKKIGVALFLRNQKISVVRKSAQSFVRKIKFNKLYKSYDFCNSSEEIYIVSASFEIYLKYIFQDPVHVVGSKLEIENGLIKSLSENCHGVQKLEALKRNGIREIHDLYSDSLSDLPLANHSKNFFLVAGDEYKKYK